MCKYGTCVCASWKSSEYAGVLWNADMMEGIHSAVFAKKRNPCSKSIEKEKKK